MDLKDLFAAHVAAALAHRVERSDIIASRAYDLAEAMLRERARRAPVEDVLAEPDLVDAFEDGVPNEEFFAAPGLLDEPAPWSDREGMELDPAWLDRDNDPRWEADPKWSAPAGAVVRPGLAKATRPDAAPAAMPIAVGDKSRRPV